MGEEFRLRAAASPHSPAFSCSPTGERGPGSGDRDSPRGGKVVLCVLMLGRAASARSGAETAL